MDVLSWQFFVVVVLGLSAIAAIAMLILEGIEKKRMGAIAARIKCTMDPKNGYRISGTYRNEQIDIFKEMISAHHRDMSTRYVIQFTKGLPFEFELFSKNILNNIFNSDTEIGIPDFDSKYILKTSDKISPVQYLQKPEVRRAIGAMTARGCDNIVFKNDGLSLRLDEPTKDDYKPDNIVYMLDKGIELLANL